MDEIALIKEVPDPNKLKILFDELEFKTVAARIFAEIDKSEKPREVQQLFVPQKESLQGTLFVDEAVAPMTEMSSILNVPHNYVLLETSTDLEEFVKRVGKLKEYCFDSETTSINPLDA